MSSLASVRFFMISKIGSLLLMALVLNACLDAQRVVLDPKKSEDTLAGVIEPSEEGLVFEGEGIVLGLSRVRRLTRAQIEHSLKDVFGEALVVPQISEPDFAEGGLISVGAGTTTLSARGISSIEELSYSIAQQVIENSELRVRNLFCSLDDTELRPCLQEILSQIGRRLWRRPLRSTELETILEVVEQASQVLGDVKEGLTYGLSALIQSPHFLYRAELGQQDIARTPFEPYALATRLSYLLWDSTPDDGLLDAAESGELDNEEGILHQVERLLASPRARIGVTRFFTEQLKLYELSEIHKDPLLFEHYNPQLMRDAREETLQLLMYIIFDQEADIREMMTTPVHFLNPRLAALYQVPAPSLDGFRLVELSEHGQRYGLLSHASVLSLNAHPTSSSATLRGKFVRNVLLCQSIPPPPVGVNTAIPEPSGTTITLRQRVAEHLENPSCAGCHQLLDPIGLGLENYDSIGQWRETEQEALIDASGVLDERSFSDPRSLGMLIREHPNFVPCMVRTLSRYALGRLETEAEEPFLTDLKDRFEGAHYNFKALLRALILSPIFRQAGAPK